MNWAKAMATGNRASLMRSTRISLRDGLTDTGVSFLAKGELHTSSTGFMEKTVQILISFLHGFPPVDLIASECAP
jgi:hypothetical protein